MLANGSCLKMVFCKTFRRTIHIFVGIIIGFLLTSEFRSLNYENFKKDIIFQLCSYQNVQQNVESKDTSDANLEKTFSVIQNLNQLHDSTNKKQLLLVGVMTAKKFIDSRAYSIYKTWAQDLNGHVIFFSSEDSNSTTDLPLISLPGVDDSYPPQKKSFLMLKFMHDFFGDKYKFFMRADDDVFVNIERMNSFLSKLNSSSTVFLGQTGVGNKVEFGQLNLNLNENFCMGGPGIILSHVTLSYLAENIRNCLKKLYSSHEDVEIGRCVKKFAGVPCTWSYDMQNLFYHNTSMQQLIKDNVYSSRELSKAITVHPIKDPVVMQKLYLHFQEIQHQEIRFKLTKAYQILNANLKHINNVNSLMHLFNFSDISQLESFTLKTNQFGLESSSILATSLGNSADSMITWHFFAQKLYSELSINPKKHIERHILQAFNTNIHRIMATINKQSFRKARMLDYHSLYYGYVKFDYKAGIQYILDLLMIYRKYQGKRMTIPIRRHAHVIQTFSKTQIKEQVSSGDDKQMVNIIVPLAGRLSIFKRFIVNFAQICHSDSFVSLSIVLFPDSNHSESNMTRQDLLSLANNYQVKVNILEINGTFSRGIALQNSLTLFRNDSLLFFIDVDIYFTGEVLSRVRRNTVKQNQVYFPIVFSQYGNKVSNYSTTKEVLSITDLDGYWRQFGFGIVSLFKEDLLTVGGYDLNINGWGMEDVSLYDRFVSSNLTIFRAIDPGLIHIFHDIHCDNGLAPIQFEMCLGTKLSSLDSVKELSFFVNSANLLQI